MPSRSLPAPLPNEHLLSTLARWFDLSGRNDFLNMARNISTNVGNLNPAAVWRPIYWDLANRYVESISWKRLICTHTLVPYHSPFISSPEKIAVLQRNEELANTKIQPVQQNRILKAHHWRWCLECAESNFEEFGTTYWHTFHQIPSVLTCYRHNTQLVSECLGCEFSYQNFQRHWLPPSDGQCRECQAPITLPSLLLIPISRRLEKLSFNLQVHGLQIDQDALLQPIKQKIGFITLPSNLTVPVREQLSAFQRQFQAWLPDDILATYFSLSRDQTFKQSNQILKLSSVAYRKRNAPPLSVLLMIMFLELDDALLGDLACRAMHTRKL